MTAVGSWLAHSRSRRRSLLMKFIGLLLSFMMFQSCATLRKQSPPKPVVDLHLDASWRCGFEKDATVCRPTDTQSELVKVILWTAKDAGPNDSLESYRQHMKQSRKVRLRLKHIASTPLWNKLVSINGVDWVDAAQANSEIAGYTTRYLATVKDSLAIVVTFSARKEIFEDFQKEIQPIIDHLEINARDVNE